MENERDRLRCFGAADVVKQIQSAFYCVREVLHTFDGQKYEYFGSLEKELDICLLQRGNACGNVWA
jgi:hypothetical protein